MGLFWSNQADGKLYFAIHLDSDADDVWQPSEEAFADPNNPKLADDHLNLAASSDGSVLVAIKRGSGGTNKPLTEVLKRDPTTGVW
jgi:hypothetical protein